MAAEAVGGVHGVTGAGHLPAAPTTLPEFQRLFADEGASREYIAAVRWPNGFTCPKCDRAQGWWTARNTIKCTNGHQTSVTAGTVMHRSKLPLATWLYGAFLVSTLTPGISALQFQRQLGIHRYETAFQMLHKLRAALVAPGREKLNREVEVDEGFVGGVEEGRPGRGADRKALVIIAVEVVHWTQPQFNKETGLTEIVERNRAGRVRLSVIRDASAETLLPWVQANIENGAKVFTDGWAGYNNLEKLGYRHERVLQSCKGKKTGRYLPMVHLIISNLKRWLLGTYKGAVSAKHLPAYLNEFTFRFNRRFWRGPAFLRALGLMVHADARPEYKTLYATGEEGGWAHPNSEPGRQDGLVESTG